MIAGELRLAGIARNDRIRARRSSPAGLSIVPIVRSHPECLFTQSRKYRPSIPHHKTDVAIHVERRLITLVDGEHEPLGTTLPSLFDGKAYDLLAVAVAAGFGHDAHVDEFPILARRMFGEDQATDVGALLRTRNQLSPTNCPCTLYPAITSAGSRSSLSSGQSSVPR